MPAGNEYRCKSCNEELLILPKYFNLLPFPEQWVRGPSRSVTQEERDHRRQDIQEWTSLHQQIFVCDPCEAILFLPKQIDGVTWNQWKREDALGHRPYSDYPFLVRLACVIDEALALRPECVMHFDQLSCPYCSQILVPKDQLSPKCKRCGSSDLEHTGSGIATMSASFPHPWPPSV
jgi:hypothetical protein